MATAKSFSFSVSSPDLRRFSKHFGKAPADMNRAQRAFELAASRSVAKISYGLAKAQGGVAAKSARDIRSAGPGTIVYGGQGYSLGAEFGSYRYKQFKTWRGNGEDAGYFLWPSIRLFRDKEFVAMWQTQVWRVVQKDFYN